MVEMPYCIDFSFTAAVAQRAGSSILAGKFQKRLWMSEHASGSYEVTNIRTGLALSLQVFLQCDDNPRCVIVSAAPAVLTTVTLADAVAAVLLPLQVLLSLSL